MLESYLPIVQYGSVIATFMLMLSIGLNTDFKRFPFFRDRLRLFTRSVIAVSLLVPLAVLFIILLVGPEFKVAVAMAILAASPAAPMSFIRIPKSGGSVEYVTSLSLWLALLSIVTAPLVITAFETLLNFPVRVSPAQIAGQISMAILLPVLLGMALRAIFPAYGKKAATPLSLLANVIVLIVTLVILVSTLDDLFIMSPSSYLSMALMVVSALMIGHAAAGGRPEERTTLAMECAFRNPGLALMIASINFPGGNPMPVLIPYLLIFTIISVIYIRWRKRYIKAGKAHERPV